MRGLPKAGQVQGCKGSRGGGTGQASNWGRVQIEVTWFHGFTSMRLRRGSRGLDFGVRENHISHWRHKVTTLWSVLLHWHLVEV